MRIVRQLVLPLLLIAAAAPSHANAQVRRHPPRPVPQPTVVILVRHAEKDRSNPLASKPDLAAAGQQRARDLERAIRGRHVNAIMTTQLKRTVQTAQPSAAAFHLAPEVYQATADGKATGAGMAELVRRHTGKTVLVVGHSNTVPATIEALGGPKLNDICDTAFSNLFILVLYPNTSRAPSFSQTHYGAPDPPGGRDCVNGLHR